MESESKPPARHTWPWFLALALLLGVVLAVLWVRAEAQRMKERRNYHYDAPMTNGTPPR